MRQKGLDFGGEELRPAAPVRPAPPRPAARRAWTVSQLTDRIQGVLETEFLDVWVEGEVSNLRLMPSSGHWYFSLKDEKAQIRAVVWKSDARYLKFQPKDGMKVVARGAVRLYPPRGEYQLSVQVIEPLGKGSLQQAFEELKEKLDKEGLFAPGAQAPAAHAAPAHRHRHLAHGRRAARHPARARGAATRTWRCSSIPAGCRGPRRRARSCAGSARSTASPASTC